MENSGRTALFAVYVHGMRDVLYSAWRFFFFFLYDGRRNGGASGFTSAKESLFPAPRPQNVHLITRGEEEIIREPK